MKIRYWLAAALSALTFNESALALSCMRTDIGQAMETAKSSDKLYYVLVGRFRTDRPAQPKSPYANQFETRPTTVSSAWFDGYALTPQREYDMPLKQFPLDMEIKCSGPWCGNAPASDRDQIAFVEARPNQSPILRISACPEWVFNVGPQQAEIQRLRDCFDRPCEVKERPNLR